MRDEGWGRFGTAKRPEGPFDAPRIASEALKLVVEFECAHEMEFDLVSASVSDDLEFKARCNVRLGFKNQLSYQFNDEPDMCPVCCAVNMVIDLEGRAKFEVDPSTVADPHRWGTEYWVKPYGLTYSDNYYTARDLARMVEEFIESIMTCVGGGPPPMQDGHIRLVV